ncbi:MAG TPA: DUF2975 domain-containing protein [Rhizomicrobium sp.]|jgi:hypothetical protein
MSQVIELSAAAPEPPVLPHRGLRLLSRALAILFTLFVAAQILWVVAAGLVTIFFSDHVRVGAAGVSIYERKPPPIPGTVLYSSQSALTRAVGMADIVIATVPILLIFWELRGLFRLYARGIVFAQENAALLKRVGLWLVVYPFAKFAANMLFQLAGGTDKAWFRMELVYALVLGLIVFVIAQVMEFGREIEQEKDSFV